MRNNNGKKIIIEGPAVLKGKVNISGSKNATAHKAGGDYFQRHLKYGMLKFKREVERAMIWGNRQNTSTSNSTSLSTLGVSVRTMEGIWGYAQGSYDAGGNLTWQKFKKDMILAMDKSVGYNDPLIMLTSREAAARFLEYPDNALRVNDKGMIEKFGIKTDTYCTSGPDIKVIAHDAFDYGNNQKKAIIFQPKELEYIYLDGRDMQIKPNIQNPSVDGRQDEIFGECSILPLDGGYSITKVENIY